MTIYEFHTTILWLLRLDHKELPFFTTALAAV